jgi:3-polyprenyl-4-hydroxybenzoate decarboxylase
METANLTVAFTGASGAIFGREMLHALQADQRVSLATSAYGQESAP